MSVKEALIKIRENEYEVDLRCFDSYVKKGYMFAYLTKDRMVWITNEGKIEKKRFITNSSETVSSSDNYLEKKFRVNLDGEKCEVVEFKKDYEEELKNSTLWKAVYQNGQLLECGLISRGNYVMFKQFENETMIEYQYDYDVDKDEIKADTKEEIYRGKYKNNSYEHYPQDDSSNEMNPNPEMMKPSDESSPEDEKNESTSIPVKQEKKDDSNTTRLTYTKDEKVKMLNLNESCFDNVQEIIVCEEGLPEVFSITIKNIQSLETIVFSNNCCKFVQRITISSLPKLKTISFEDNCCCNKEMKVKFENLDELNEIRIGKGVFGVYSEITLDNLPKFTTIESNYNYLFNDMKSIVAKNCPLLSNFKFHKDYSFLGVKKITIINSDEFKKFIKDLRPKLHISTN